MKYSEILAKSDPVQTLYEHTGDCLQWFRQVIDWNNDFIIKVAEQYSLSQELLIQRLFIMVAFHDIGKSTDQYQDKIRKVPPHIVVSHALPSVSFIYDVVKNRPLITFDDTPYFPEIISIATHHSKLRKNLFESMNHDNLQYADIDYYNSFYTLVNQQANRLGIKYWEDVRFNEQVLNMSPLNVLNDEVLLNLEEDGFVYERSNVIRDLLVLFKSVLHYCDWLASSQKDKFNYSTPVTFNDITEKMKQKEPQFVKWFDFQMHSFCSGSKNIFVQIPTGQGKTEAAALWATSCNKNQKILCLLPTMVTTNKMWTRMSYFFGGDEEVGLSHSSAQYMLKEKNENLETEVLRQHFLYNKTFFKPVTVATIDQLIYSFFNWGYWVLTGSASYNAKIIIDEIHIYDAYTFGLLLGVIKYIQPFNSKFAIMSASLPNILKEELSKVLPNYEIIKDDVFNNQQRHILTVKDCLIEECRPDIMDEYYSGRKILIVCNTIKKAREVYNSLGDVPEKRKILYHSQFVMMDKISKEDILMNIQGRDGAFIAICTQIVEVSLDIDFDVLYTENAPIDAIIQRLGRVNRKGKIKQRIPNMDYAKVVITRESENSRKYVYKDLSNVLSQTYSLLSKMSQEKSGCLTEADFKEIVEIVYTKENLGDAYYDLLNEGKVLIANLWSKYLLNIYTLNLEEAKLHEISSRRSNYITVDAVLLCHYQKFNFDEVVAIKDFDLLRKYTLKVPIHIVKKYAIRKINDADIYLLDIKYNEDEGVSLAPDDQIFL